MTKVRFKIEQMNAVKKKKKEIEKEQKHET